MPDPYGKVQAGDPIEITAAAWNAALLAGQNAQRGQLDARAPQVTNTLSATVIRVLNASGDDLPRNSILGLGDPIFTPDDTSLDAFMQEVTFRGYRPNTLTDKRKYVVTVDPAPHNRVVRAYIAGVCQVQINQRDEAHEYAIIDDGVTFNLKSSRHGHARILWREGLQGYGYGYYDTGIQWAIVMLGVTGSSGSIGRANGSIGAGSSGSYGEQTYGTGNVDLYRVNGATEDGPLETIPVLNGGVSIGDTKRVFVEWDAEDVAYVAPLEC